MSRMICYQAPFVIYIIKMYLVLTTLNMMYYLPTGLLHGPILAAHFLAVGTRFWL